MSATPDQKTPARRTRASRPGKPHTLGRGDLRLLLLALLEPQPRHGYELIQLIGGMFFGQYMPSPGAVYPTLAQLEHEGLVAIRTAGARRLHTLTDAGRDFVEAHAEAIAEATQRTRHSARGFVRASQPEAVHAQMDALKQALASHHPHWSAASADAVAAILQQAAAAIAAVPHSPADAP